MPDLDTLSLNANLGIFVTSATLVWIAGTRITRYADQISARTGMGEALMGILLVAMVTSLPEIATSFSAAQSGDAPLAVNNLLGSIAMQIAVLAVGDFIYGRHALTCVVPDPVVILQGALNIVLLSLVAMAIVLGDRQFFGAGYWTWGLLAGAAYSFFKLGEANHRRPWIANPELEEDQVEPLHPDNTPASNQELGMKTIACAVIILGAGFIVARSGEAIASQSGLGSSFMGVAFVALATSLPEVSTVFAALRRGLYTMAISNILGTNIINVALLFGADMVASGEPVLNRVGDFGVLAALLGALLTSVFLIGLAERRDRTIGRMGIDSVLVLLFYSGGLALLYTLRNA